MLGIKPETDCPGANPPAPSRHDQPAAYDRTLYELRHRVENFFQPLERFRRIATRYEKLAASYYAMLCFAAVMLWLP